MAKLWLDDVRPAPEGWLWAKTVGEAKFILSNNDIEECSLDHDLGVEARANTDEMTIQELREYLSLRGDANETGYDLVLWMLFMGHYPKKVTIHSWNPEGARMMAKRFRNYGINAEIRPYELP